jgi:signal transduction histidine kinase
MPGFRDYSILKKLTRMNMIVSGVALGLACVVLIAYDLISVREAIMHQLLIQAQIIGSNSASALLFADPQSAEKTLSALRSAPNITDAAITGARGQTFATYSRDSGEQRPSGTATIAFSSLRFDWFNNRKLVASSPIVLHGKTVGAVYIRSDLQELIHRLERYVVIVGVVFLISLAAAVLMSSQIRRVVTEPILNLVETARIVSRERTYSVRVRPSRNRDELSTLIDTFNEMLEQIQKRDTALQEVQDSLEQRVQERTAQLNAVNADLEAFSYSVSHDLRAPLRHISSFSQILRSECGATMNEESSHYLERIQDAASNMAQLVEGLLKLGRIGRRELACVVTDLDSLVKDVLIDMQPELEGRKIDWQIADLPSIECDPGLVKQVFTNLLSNAVKYTRARETAVIEVGRIGEEEVPVFFVRDNGAGFDQRYAGKLFGVFERLHRADEFEGTGVGLSTVQRIVKKHGGEIWAKAEVDKGATFFFALAPRGGSPAAANCVPAKRQEGGERTPPPSVESSPARHASG